MGCNLEGYRRTDAALRRFLMSPSTTVTSRRLAAWEAHSVSTPDFWLNHVLEHPWPDSMQHAINPDSLAAFYGEEIPPVKEFEVL